MIIKRLVTKEVYEDVRPGDKIMLDNDPKCITTVRRVVENRKHTYVVLTNTQWRPVSTYGKTWCKLGVN